MAKVRDTMAVGKNSGNEYMPSTYIIIKGRENAPHMLTPISENTAYARGAGESEKYLASYSDENIIDIIDSMSNIFMGLFIVMYWFE